VIVIFTGLGALKSCKKYQRNVIPAIIAGEVLSLSKKVN
jgi:hypothetical protein